MRRIVPALAAVIALASVVSALVMVAFKDTFARGLRMTGVLTIPTSAIMVALSVPLVTLYRVGAFTRTCSSCSRQWTIRPNGRTS